MSHAKIYYAYGYKKLIFVLRTYIRRGGEEIMKKVLLIMLSLLIAISLTMAMGCQKAKEQAVEMKEKAAETAGGVKEKAAETAGAVKEKATETAAKVKEKTADTKK
jgi:preprotein translocase subunit SecG